MNICLCEGADVDEEVKEGLEKGFNRLRRCSDPPPLKRYMPRRLFNLLQFRTTPLGATLLDVVRVGLMHFDAEIGAYAPDQYSYDTYQVLFDRLVEDRHGFQLNQVHAKSNWGDWDRLINLDPESKYIISTRVRCARNLDGFRFSPTMSPVDYETVESVIVQMLELLPWEYSGQYISLQSMTDEVISQLIDHHLFFLQGNEHERAGNISRFWPMGRGVFFNKDYSFGVWVNEKDHLRAIAIEPGGNLREAYKRIAVVMPVLEKRLPPATHDRFGYLTVCPGNVGTALRLSVLIRMPNAPWEQIVRVAKVYCLEVDEIEKQVFCISNKRSLGYSEYALAVQFIHGAREMINLQMTNEARGTILTESEESLDGELQSHGSAKVMLMQKLLTTTMGVPNLCDLSNTCPCNKRMDRIICPRRIAGAMSVEIEYRKANKISISKAHSTESTVPENPKTAGGDTLQERGQIGSPTRMGKQSPLRGTKSTIREMVPEATRKVSATVSALRGVESTPVTIQEESSQNYGSSNGSKRGNNSAAQKDKNYHKGTDQNNSQHQQRIPDKSGAQLSPKRSVGSMSPSKSHTRSASQQPQQKKNDVPGTSLQKRNDRTNTSQQKSPNANTPQPSPKKGDKNGAQPLFTNEWNQSQLSSLMSVATYQSDADISRERCDEPGRKPSRKLYMSSKALRGSLVKIPSIRSTRASTTVEKKSIVDFINPEKKKEKKSKKNWKQVLWV